MPTITPEQIIGKNSPPTLRGRMEMIAAIKDYAAQLVAEATAWRPMDTAPTDGTEFIGIIENGNVYRAKYFEGERIGHMKYELRRSKSFDCIRVPDPMLIELSEDRDGDLYDVPTVQALIHRTTTEHVDLHYSFWEYGLTHNFVGWRPL